MSIIATIEYKITQLDGGSFQKLCDQYLHLKGYKEISSLGMKEGTHKTTAGTPDSYFQSKSNKFIFAEYTTQRANLFKKIKDDIDKCLNPSITHISPDEIEEIIYCHTLSTLKPHEYLKLTNICEAVGVKLTILGITQIASDLYHSYPKLLKDFLQISICTNQIQCLDDFICDYDKNGTVAPLKIDFLHRCGEIEKIDIAFNSKNVVVLTGPAGIGKTRLALHYAKEYSNTHNAELLCIHNNGLPIHEDLINSIDLNKDYFFILDDANQLTSLEYIIEYLSSQFNEKSFKILITVRNYAFEKVKQILQNKIDYAHIVINILNDEEIRTLLQNSLNIQDHRYQDKIIRIADGNARLAVLAGNIALKSNMITSINDASELYENYYGEILTKEDSYFTNDLCIAGALLSFLDKIDFEHMDDSLIFLNIYGISKESFISNIYTLHKLEFVDICNNKVAGFSDQCFSNFLLKYTLFDRKFVSLSELIKTHFTNYSNRVVYSVNTLLNIFINQELFTFVKDEVCKTWDYLAHEDPIIFFNFIKSFFRFNPTSTLSFLKDIIDKEKRISVNVSDIDATKSNDEDSIKATEYIKILCGFTNMSDLPIALDLVFEYYLKRPDLYNIFFTSLSESFTITHDSISQNFAPQIDLLEKIKENSNDWKNDFITILFLNIAKQLLKLFHQSAELGRKNSVSFAAIFLKKTDSVQRYRELIWKYILDICVLERYTAKIREVLQSYGDDAHNEDSEDIIKFDFTYIKQIFNSTFPATEFENSLLAEKVQRKIINPQETCQNFFEQYFDSEQFRLYKLITTSDLSVQKEGNQRSCLINQFISQNNFEEFKKIINLCTQFSQNSWDVSENLTMMFEVIYKNKPYYYEAVKYYIYKDTPHSINPCEIVKNLFNLSSESDIFNLINKFDFNQKNSWLYSYYKEIPQELITDTHLKKLYKFLSCDSYKNLRSSSLRSLNFLDKYSNIDENVFIKGCGIIFEKYKDIPFMLKIYFKLLFNTHRIKPKELIEKFESNLILLKNIYCEVCFTKHSIDYDGQFFKEIYLVDPSILSQYINYLLKDSDYSYREENILICFFDFENFLEIYDAIFENLIKESQFPEISLTSYLREILRFRPNKADLTKKQDFWIKHCIQSFATDELKMYLLFSVVSEFDTERKNQYYMLFLTSNHSLNDFKKLPLKPTTVRFSGSFLPTHHSYIKFLEQLSSKLNNLQWLKQREYLEEEIKGLKATTTHIEINEFLRG